MSNQAFLPRAADARRPAKRADERSALARATRPSEQIEGADAAQARPENVTAGTVTIGQSMRDRTFALLRDATRITGSWTCC